MNLRLLVGFAGAILASALEGAISVRSPRLLPDEPIACERIPLGGPDDYKPCIARLPSGELLLVAFHPLELGEGKVREQNLLFRSGDGGRTWRGPENLPLLGREPYLTVLPDGTVFETGHLLAADIRNHWGYTCGFLHRSTDGGHTWQSLRFPSEGIRPGATNYSSRNVLRRADGTLLLGVDYEGGPHFMWRSTDGGRSWDRTRRCEPRDFHSAQDGFFGGELWLWPAKSGKIWALTRVNSVSMPIVGRPLQSRNDHNDQDDHFVLYSSTDEGRTFDRGPDFGDYGEMYLSLLRLQDRRLLLTLTVRSLHPPLGVQALVGIETKDGFAFDFSHDRLLLDRETPAGQSQGGGFSPTVQAGDGTLVTATSYRGADARTHLEVIRWRLPRPRAR
jgi:hypothetical protein